MDTVGPLGVMGLDEHPMLMEGVAAVIGRELPGFRWLGSAQSPGRLEALMAALGPPDILLVDLHSGGGADLETRLRDWTSRGIACVIYTAELRPVPLRRAVEAGACGLALKSDPIASLLDVLEVVSAGEFAVSGELAHALVTDPDLVPRLAPRELETLVLLGEGLPRKAVGRRMTPPVGTATVVTYVNRVGDRYRSLGRPVNSVADVIRAATQDGYL
ncbi:response regulator transcription factor [Knoellia subterranea]|uniref:LuxR family transcriptional regulator n=1 Tax=Knoellia subterranea KCTC 19937 TaxID=1385521 RepID=A0A0A0JJA9_9MICO|nr:response regulator transcription factor [Knoellia subterranea]KGN37490.1 LuxR family transcriptional regulator [Knoellia subterranea KCTC 19937]